jgi:hypothetical protein
MVSALVLLGGGLCFSAYGQQQSMLFDFGGADAQTGQPTIFWNNIDEGLGSTFGGFQGLVDSDGNDTGIQLWVDQPFDETANQAGTDTSDLYPSSATADSLVSSSGSAMLTLVNDSGNQSQTFTLTFFASDLAATDNRETTFEIYGLEDYSVFLNPSGNVLNSVSVSDVEFDVELPILLAPGPNHTDQNTIVYLGVLQVDSSAGWTAYIDFGSADATTSTQGSGDLLYWNNLTGSIGSSDTGVLSNLVSTDGFESDLAIQMVARFGGVNEAGTLLSTIYPVSATRDSLFGNTEEFQGLTDVYPIFMVTGLDPAVPYDFTFYASRMSTGGDIRETLYTVTGATVAETTLNASENLDQTASVFGMQPNAFGEVTIALTPGPNNNNSLHFTYLGALQIELPGQEQTFLVDFGGSATTEVVVPDSDRWNNVVESVGQTNDGVLTQLAKTSGVKTDYALQMLARFNGVNRNGTTESTSFPASATSDSMFGNTAEFSGLANVFPEFKLTGLDPLTNYDFRFFGSRNSVSDNRETRFTVTGTNSVIADLDTANNVEATADAAGVTPNAAGEITIAITPGPNNTNSTGFTYLGVMEVAWENTFVPQIVIDGGGTGNPTPLQDDGTVWNNLLSNVAESNTGILPGLKTVNGTETPFAIEMIARFTGVNENGTLDPTAPYPATATRDSLYGNTEEWSGLSNIFPQFKITGLDPQVAYTLTFYASRTSVSDIRETEFTVDGTNQVIVTQNASNNIDQTVQAADIMPAPDGSITVSIAPGPNNDNGYHFTYMGVLQIDWEGGLPNQEDELVSLSQLGYSGGVLTFTLTGRSGQTYTIQGSDDLQTWDDLKQVTLAGDSEEVTVETLEPAQFYRAVR